MPYEHFCINCRAFICSGRRFGPWVRAVFTASGPRSYFTACIMLKSQKIFRVLSNNHADPLRKNLIFPRNPEEFYSTFRDDVTNPLCRKPRLPVPIRTICFLSISDRPPVPLSGQAMMLDGPGNLLQSVVPAGGGGLSCCRR